MQRPPLGGSDESIAMKDSQQTSHSLKEVEARPSRAGLGPVSRVIRFTGGATSQFNLMLPHYR